MARPGSRRQQLLACWPLETSLVTWTFGGDATVLADYALTTTTTTNAFVFYDSIITNVADYRCHCAFQFVPIVFMVFVSGKDIPITFVTCKIVYSFFFFSTVLDARAGRTMNDHSPRLCVAGRWKQLSQSKSGLPSNSTWPYLSSDLLRSERAYC